MLKISQLPFKNVPKGGDDRLPERMTHGVTEPTTGANTEGPYQPVHARANSTVVVAAAVAETTAPSTPIAGWETEGGALPQLSPTQPIGHRAAQFDNFGSTTPAAAHELASAARRTHSNEGDR